MMKFLRDYLGWFCLISFAGYLTIGLAFKRAKEAKTRKEAIDTIMSSVWMFLIVVLLGVLIYNTLLWFRIPNSAHHLFVKPARR